MSREVGTGSAHHPLIYRNLTIGRLFPQNIAFLDAFGRSLDGLFGLPSRVISLIIKLLQQFWTDGRNNPITHGRISERNFPDESNMLKVRPVRPRSGQSWISPGLIRHIPSFGDRPPAASLPQLKFPTKLGYNILKVLLALDLSTSTRFSPT